MGKKNEESRNRFGAPLFDVTARAGAATAPVCDRACLDGFVDRYLDAMQAHAVRPDLFAREAKFTENGIRLPLGNEGLWFEMSGKGTYKFYVPDVETQQVAFIGTLREGGTTRPTARSSGSRCGSRSSRT